MNVFTDHPGYYSGGLSMDPHRPGRFLIFVPPGRPPWEGSFVPIVKAHRLASIGWGNQGWKWQAAAANTARSILTHAAGAAVGTTHYRDFAADIVTRAPAGPRFGVELDDINTWLQQRGVHLPPPRGMRPSSPSPSPVPADRKRPPRRPDGPARSMGLGL